MVGPVASHTHCLQNPQNSPHNTKQIGEIGQGFEEIFGGFVH